MKLNLTIFLFLLARSYTTCLFAQQEETEYVDWTEEVGGNDYFKATMDSLGIRYSYSNENQTHNYSGNFDFDGDLLNDSLYFVGTGGAHLYYFPRIFLSSTKKSIDFEEINIDDPQYFPVSSLAALSFLFFFTPQFVVGTNKDLLNEENQLISRPSHVIFFRLDSHYYGDDWKKQGINSNYVLLYFENSAFIIRNFH